MIGCGISAGKNTALSDGQCIILLGVNLLYRPVHYHRNAEGGNDGLGKTACNHFHVILP